MIIQNPVNTTVTVNDTLTLNCTAVNNEDAPNLLTFVWVINGVVRSNIDPTGTRVGNNTYLSQLVVERVTREDDGTYVCRVHNRVFEDIIDGDIVRVTVQCK